MKTSSALVAGVLAVCGSTAQAENIPVGAAPKGNATAVATRIIKYNFPNCQSVSGASRRSDGAIRATCDNIAYLVFTVFKADEGKLLEVAMNCEAAKKLTGTGC